MPVAPFLALSRLPPQNTMKKKKNVPESPIQLASLQQAVCVGFVSPNFRW